ncbi:MAG: gliding motility lipoprotein GldH [Prevotella sp.]|nr:gliding motility lipoprotein GldH [Prevotella sp.]
MMAAATTAAIISSCQLNTTYSRYQSTHIEGWEKNDTLFYEVPPVDAAGRFIQTLGIRIGDAFPFTSISLVVEQRIFPGRRSKVDTLRCNFTDDQGRLKGPGINLHQYEFPIGTIDLRPGDSLSIKVRHTMKREIMPGISDVGIQIERMP